MSLRMPRVPRRPVIAGEGCDEIDAGQGPCTGQVSIGQLVLDRGLDLVVPYALDLDEYRDLRAGVEHDRLNVRFGTRSVGVVQVQLHLLSEDHTVQLRLDAFGQQRRELLLPSPDPSPLHLPLP